jgi:hypothetical protein
LRLLLATIFAAHAQQSPSRPAPRDSERELATSIADAFTVEGNVTDLQSD